MGGIQHAQHGQAILAIGQGLCPLLDAIDKVLAFQPERLAHIDAGNVDIAEAQRVQVGVADLGKLDAMVVDLELLAAGHIVKHGHLVTAHYGKTPHLVRIQPAHVAVGQRTVGEMHGHKDQIVNPRLQKITALRTDGHRLLVQ